MSNAYCRAILDKKVTTGTNVKNFQIPPKLHIEDIAIATANADKCVIGSANNFEDTNKVLGLWFPWIGDIDNKNFIFTSKTPESRRSIKPELRKVLEDANECDIALYKHMLERFELQMTFLSSFISENLVQV